MLYDPFTLTLPPLFAALPPVPAAEAVLVFVVVFVLVLNEPVVLIEFFPPLVALALTPLPVTPEVACLFILVVLFEFLVEVLLASLVMVLFDAVVLPLTLRAFPPLTAAAPVPLLVAVGVLVFVLVLVVVLVLEL